MLDAAGYISLHPDDGDGSDEADAVPLIAAQRFTPYPIYKTSEP
jgi:hypothetical protein